MAYRGKRSKKVSPYHYCGRCGTKQHLSNLTWQRGVLVCKQFDCQDTMLIGEREAMIKDALTNSPDMELRPDEKLISPSASQQDDIVF